MTTVNFTTQYLDRYKVEYGCYPEVFSPRFGYHLLFMPYQKPGLEVQFITDKTGLMPISGRDFEDYPSNIVNNCKDPSLRYLEVGAGLSGLVSFILAHQTKSSPRVVVIDFANYYLMKDMLMYALENVSISEHHTKRAKLYLSRCEEILDPTKVLLVNKKLGEAVKDTELHGIADVIIDHYGPRRHAFTELISGRDGWDQDINGDIDSYEKLLLKPGGKILSFTGK